MFDRAALDRRPAPHAHSARNLPQRPVGPRPGAIPLLIGGNGPKGQRHAALHADTWSGYAEERAHVHEMAPRLAVLDAICAEIGRDPASIGRGAGVSVNPLRPSGWREDVLSGCAEEIADGLRSFREAGFAQVDLMLGPGTIAAMDAMAPVVELLRAGRRRPPASRLFDGDDTRWDNNVRKAAFGRLDMLARSPAWPTSRRPAIPHPRLGVVVER